MGEWITRPEAQRLLPAVLPETEINPLFANALKHHRLEVRWPEGADRKAIWTRRPLALYRPTEKGVAHAREYLKRWVEALADGRYASAG